MSAGGSRREWGWHRLADEWAARIVAAAEINPGDLVLDIGAGDGSLTSHLVRAGARVIAVELHPGRCERLRTRFADAPVTVLRVDASQLLLPGKPFRVVANPPYSISNGLLRLLLSRHSRLVAADVVLQTAVVRRWATGRAPGAGRWRREYDAQPGLKLPRSAFQPPPKVDSGVLVLRARRGGVAAAYHRRNGRPGRIP